MITSTREVQQLQQLLRNVAEVDPCDQTANIASQLAVDLEMMILPFHRSDLTDSQIHVLEYAESKRLVYVLLPEARHAVNLELLTDA